jgi:hypothetical protein
MASSNSQSIRPSKFRFSIGGFGGASHEFELGEAGLRYANGMGGFADPASARIITPSDSKWRNFIAKLDSIGVWKWRQNYLNPFCCDGTQWELEVKLGNRSKRSSGSNDYPGKDGKPCGYQHPPEQFEAFLKALFNLTGIRVR